MVPPADPPFSGAIFSDIAGITKVADLGLGCLYGGGGQNHVVPSRVPDGFTSILEVASCTGSVLTLQASPAGDPATCTQGSLPTKHCAKAPSIPCLIASDCSSHGGPFCIADTRCYAGPPVPNPSLGNEACAMQVFTADVSGTIDPATGLGSLTFPLASRLYLTGNISSPCPKCVGGVCNDGKRTGLSCVPVGSMQTTLDCPPFDGGFIAELPLTLTLGAGPVTLTSSLGLFCPNQITSGAFGKSAVKRIEQIGTPAGDLRDMMPHVAQLASIFCIPASSNSVLNGTANIPGPGVFSLGGIVQLQ